MMKETHWYSSRCLSRSSSRCVAYRWLFHPDKPANILTPSQMISYASSHTSTINVLPTFIVVSQEQERQVYDLIPRERVSRSIFIGFLKHVANEQFFQNLTNTEDCHVGNEMTSFAKQKRARTFAAALHIAVGRRKKKRLFQFVRELPPVFGWKWW